MKDRAPILSTADRLHADRLVVVAASAGGVAALTQVLSQLPADLPAAIAVVQHLRKNRPTRLAELLNRECRLQVVMAREGMTLEPGVVAVAMPGEHLTVDKTRCLRLNSQSPVNYVRPSADVLFVSAAEVFESSLIGVVLSGTGHDGAAGLREIRARGGTTIAQQPCTAGHCGMPEAAIATGAVEYVLAPQQIAETIVRLILDTSNSTRTA